MANKSFVVEYIIRAREKFSAAATKVARSSDTMRKSVDSSKKSMAALTVKIRAARSKLKELFPTLAGAKAKFKQLDNVIKNTKNRLKDFSETAKGVRDFGAKMAIGVTLPIALMVRTFKNAARDAIETRSKFAAVFKDISAESEAAADNLAKNFGLTGTAARQLIGDTGDILTGFGFTQKGALDLATQVNELAVDLASFTNFSGGAEGASAALTKALLGERESLKTLGVAILENDVKARVAKLVSEGQRFASLRQAKAVATLSLAMEQSKNAIGDFARTSEELANQERITSARIKDLKESFGKILLPVALKVTRAIRSMAERLTALSPQAKKTILVVGGIVAVLGPLLLLLGSVGLAIPLITAGFAVMGVVSLAALWPIALVAAAIAAAAVLIIRNWDIVKSFFSGFAKGISTEFGPTFSRLVDKFQEVAGTIASLFGSDSEASQSLRDFSNLGLLIGTAIGGSLDLVVKGILGTIEVVSQALAILSPFSKRTSFDFAAIKAEFLGPEQTPPAEISAVNKVDVGVNVGLAQGLETTSKPQVTATNARRTDVGVGAAAL